MNQNPFSGFGCAVLIALALGLAVLVVALAELVAGGGR